MPKVDDSLDPKMIFEVYEHLGHVYMVNITTGETRRPTLATYDKIRRAIYNWAEKYL